MGTDLSRALGEIADAAAHAAPDLPAADLRTRLVRRAAARAAAVVTASAAAVAGLGLAAAALLPAGTPPAGPPDDEPTTSAPAPSTTPEPTEDATDEPTAGSTTDPSTDPGATDVVLGREGVGGVAMGAEDPMPALTDLLGEPDVVGPGEGLHCTEFAASVARWGDLVVTLARNAPELATGPDRLMGWWVVGPDLPPGVRTASGVVPGVPMGDVLALPGAEEVFWGVNRRQGVRASDIFHFAAELGPEAPVETVAYGVVDCR